jgi:hypothetical protein
VSIDYQNAENSMECDLTPENLLNLASGSAQEYAAEIEASSELLEYKACSKLLRKGIRIYETIILVEQCLREAEARDEFDFTRELQNSMIEIYETWLQGAIKATDCVNHLSKLGLVPDQWVRFESVVARVERSIESRKSRRDKLKSITGAMLRASAENNRPPQAWYEGEDDC